MSRFGRLLGAALSVGVGVALAPVLMRAAWSCPHRVAVAGHSMEPSLRDGDWLLVDPDAYRQGSPRRGDLVVARDPRDARRTLIKRVGEVDDGRLSLVGDHPAHASDAETLGLVDASAVLGRPWFRYWPLPRVGPVR
jgi:nickel-type superoxide dismutase maturation protease